MVSGLHILSGFAGGMFRPLPALARGGAPSTPQLHPPGAGGEAHPPARRRDGTQTGPA